MLQRKKSVCAIGEVMPPLRKLAENKAELLKAALAARWRVIAKDTWAEHVHVHHLEKRGRGFCLYLDGVQNHPLVLRHEGYALMKRINDYLGYNAIVALAPHQEGGLRYKKNHPIKKS